MSGKPLRFWVDFASPYAWLAFDEVYRLAEAAGRSVELEPVLLWAVLKAQGLAPPMEHAAKRAYMMADMRRSAAYLGLPLVLPEPFMISTHAAARLCRGLALRGGAMRPLARALFEARFVQGRDLSQGEVLVQIGADHGLTPEAVAELTALPEARAALVAANERAAAQGIFGLPFLELEGEGFFGADRLPQLRWRLGL